MDLRKKCLLKALLKVVLADFMCLVLLLFYMVFYRKAWLLNNIVFGVCELLVMLLVMADYCLKQGNTLRYQVKFHGLEECEGFGFSIGLVSVIPSYISIVFLLLGKLKILGNTLSVYYMTNTFFAPIFNLFSLNFTAPDPNATTSSSTAANTTWLSIIVALVLPFAIILTCYYFFKMGYNNEDVTSLFVYKKQNKKQDAKKRFYR